MLNTQNTSAQHGISVGLKTSSDLHTDRSVQSLREPWDPGSQRVTAPSIPGLPPYMEPLACNFQPLMKPQEGSEQPQRGWKLLALDHGSQPLITPSDHNLLPTTLACRPGIVTPLPSCFMAYVGGVLSRILPSPSRKFG